MKKPYSYRLLIEFLSLFLLFLIFFNSPPQLNHAHALQVVRDAQLDRFMHDISKDLFKAADLDIKDFDVYIYIQPEINAFVSKKGLFVSSGLLLEAETPNEVIGVLAHELGHLKAGHLVLYEQKLQKSNENLISSFLLGIGTAAAIGLAGGNIEAASGLGIGVLAIGSNAASDSFFTFRRHQEGIADIIGFELLEKTRQSAKGLVNLFMLLQKKSASIIKDPFRKYALTHPKTSSRIQNLNTRAKKSPFYHLKDKKKLSHRYHQVKAKLAGFIGQQTYQNFVNDDKFSADDKKLAKAINLYRRSQLEKASKIMSKLIKKNPQNPYFNEFYGQILLETGNAKKALPYFEKSVQKVQNTPFNRIIYAQALILAGMENKKFLRQAIEQLNTAVKLNKRLAINYILLARAYAELKNQGLAELFTAYAKIHAGQRNDARIHAQKAIELLPKESRYWLLADDLIKILKQ